MKKAVLATMVSLAFVIGTVSAAPIQDSNQFNISYQSGSLDSGGSVLGDMGDLKVNDYDVVYRLNDKLSFIGGRMESEAQTDAHWSIYGPLSNFKIDSTELGLGYRINDLVTVKAGHIKSQYKSDQISNSTSEIFGGVAFNATLANKVDGYASYLKSAHVDDIKAGMKYQLNTTATIDVSYNDYKDSNIHVNAKGITAGLNYKL